MNSQFENLRIKATSPKGVATEIRRFLIKTFALNPDYVFVWSPSESENRGYGSCWTLCAEEGPFEWSSEATGWSPALANHQNVFTECYNSYILTFRNR